MKLLFCLKCGDLFNLQKRLKTCTCKATQGRYVNELEAVVNGEGVSVAIGNGSLLNAIANLPNAKGDWREEKGDSYRKPETSVICWVRPHEGQANPHTTIGNVLATNEETV